MKDSRKRPGRRSGAILLTTLLALTACGGDEAPAAGNGAGSAAGADAESVAESVVGEVVYVDVRTPEEYAAGHVQGAINIPHTEMPERWTELERHRGDRLVLYCRTGRRSGIALDVLRAQGFENLENAGGLQGLSRQGVPTTR